MDIYEMHVLFRTLGQQQGLQLVRGILPESIDSFLQEAIEQTVRILLMGNTKGSQDVRTPQYTKISEISSISTLFCTEEQNITVMNEGDLVNLIVTNLPYVYTNFALKYKNKKVHNCRIIESERIYQTLDDYLNRASREYPIVTLANGKSDKELELALYTGDNQKDVLSIITSYIKYPAKVYFDEAFYEQEDSSTENTLENHSVNCDLPEHMHRTVVELAVQIWFESLGLTSKQEQNQDNNQQKQ